MATLYVRDIPDSLYRDVQKTAEEHGRSLSSFVMVLLERAMEDEKVFRKRSRALAQLRQRREPLPPGSPDSVEVLRLIREGRG